MRSDNSVDSSQENENPVRSIREKKKNGGIERIEWKFTAAEYHVHLYGNSQNPKMRDSFRSAIDLIFFEKEKVTYMRCVLI